MSTKRSSHGLLGTVKTVGIVKDLMEIWLNEVYDTLFLIVVDQFLMHSYS